MTGPPPPPLARRVDGHHARLADQRGLVGRAVVTTLVLLVLVGIGAVEAASILFTRLRLEDVAAAAAIEGAQAYETSRDVNRALQAAEQEVVDKDDRARLAPNRFNVDARTGEVTVTVFKRASTLIVDRIPYFRRFALVRVTETAQPPP